MKHGWEEVGQRHSVVVIEFLCKKLSKAHNFKLKTLSSKSSAKAQNLSFLKFRPIDS